ncbi:unnamed protein product [Linum trigynum]|uniref:RNase H type-1 domain-containing protein n=1 Tax=Linum trigynum TaxID=586398 RepID=A0AAV2E9U5_9ROSI
MVILYGVRLVKEEEIGPIVVESDCKKVIEILKHGKIGRTKLGVICSDMFKEDLYALLWSQAHVFAHLVSGSEETHFHCNGLQQRVADVVAFEAFDS